MLAALFFFSGMQNSALFQMWVSCGFVHVFATSASAKQALEMASADMQELVEEVVW